MSLQTSIIIVSHNNFETTTGPCLESLLHDHENHEYEIIVVDNASTDNTPEKVKELTAGIENVRLFVNDNNRGFAGGNNDGVGLAKGEILILLNSDTRVPDRAIAKLSGLMTSHPEWGMLGPVTNEAGNEQKIFMESRIPGEIMREGEEWCVHSNCDHFPSERLDFFCIAVRGSVYKQLGGLDERFGMGYYEDADFCLRAKGTGVKMMFTEDCFVYHSSGKSFSNIGKKNVKKLMSENKRKLRNKHSGAVELYNMRNRNMKIMNQYVNLRRNPDSRRHDFDYKFNNRVALAKTLYPHSPFKKLLYHIQIRHICSRYHQ